MDKEITNKLKEHKVKEREDKMSKRARGTQFTQVERTIQRIIEKEGRVKFNEAWFAVSIRANGEKFHNNFRVGY
jgi:hypothetical protein